MITVRLPSMLRTRGRPAEWTLPTDVATLDDLVRALDEHFPGLAAELDDAIYNFAVNDTMILHGVRQHPLQANDIVEIVPTISGGYSRRKIAIGSTDAATRAGR